MNKKYILTSLYKIANTLDNSGLHREASSLTNVMKRIAEEDLTPEDPKPAYDYKEERLYKEVLSDFGKEYVADRNRENPITSFKEFDAAIYHAYQTSNPKRDQMFLSPFEQSQNVFTQLNPDVAELLRGMFMIERGIDDDKTFQSFKGNIFPALKKKMTIDKSNEYHKLLIKAKSLLKKAAGKNWNQSGAQSSMDNLLRYIINDDYNKEYRDEAYSIMEEAQRLHDQLKSDEANMPKYPIDVPKF
jgi:hypothetical protein